ncbi:MAG: hypothetical protein ACFFCQ_17540 [Promethearchaeota archaeon]
MLEESEKEIGVKTVIPKRKKPPKSVERELKFEWDTIHAETHYLWRAFLREMIGFWDPVEIGILLIFLSLFIFALYGLTVAILPIFIGIISEGAREGWSGYFEGTFWSSGNTRTFFAIGGGIAWLIRQMRKSEFDKFARKVNAQRNVTYVFGTSPYAEQIIFHTTKRLGLEERVAIIADRNLFWVQGSRGKCPAFVVENIEEFSKSNLYEKLKFKNAERIFILTENVELNQEILTYVRLWTDAEVILLSQYTPGFLHQIPLKEQNIRIIEDLEANIEDLVFSLSLDIDMPLGGAVEALVPRCYVGSPAEMMNTNPNLRKLSVIGIRRGEQILDSWETLQKGDYVILISDHNNNLKRTIRSGRELSSRLSPSEVLWIGFFGIIFFLLGLFILGPIIGNLF